MIYKYRHIYFTGYEVKKLFRYFNSNDVRFEFFGDFGEYIKCCSDLHFIKHYPDKVPQFLFYFSNRF